MRVRVFFFLCFFVVAMEESRFGRAQGPREEAFRRNRPVFVSIMWLKNFFCPASSS